MACTMAMETAVIGNTRRELNCATFSRISILSAVAPPSSTASDGWMRIRMEARTRVGPTAIRIGKSWVAIEYHLFG